MESLLRRRGARDFPVMQYAVRSTGYGLRVTDYVLGSSRQYNTGSPVSQGAPRSRLHSSAITSPMPSVLYPPSA